MNTLIVNGQAKYFWTCMHCGFNLGGQAFQNRKARIHLSGNNSLRDGSISMVCSKAPGEVQKQFTDLELESREKLQQNAASRKRCAELLSGSPQLADPSGTAASRKRRRQTRLPSTQPNSDTQVDDAWGKAFFGLNIAANKISHPLFREAIQSTVLSKSSYKPPCRQALYGPILDRLHSACVTEQKHFLQNGVKGYGRAIVGDGATILGNKFINFLIHEHGKGVMLASIKDCSKRLAETGTIDVKYIAHEMLKVIKSCGTKSVYLVVCDGGADWQAVEKMITTSHPTPLDPLRSLCGSRGVVDYKRHM